MTFHITWLVNSAAHHSGYQTFRTGDKSTNNWWVAFLAWGEGWHNNHHAFQTSARHGMRWWEFDATYLAIRAMSFLGLARKVKLPKLTHAAPIVSRSISSRFDSQRHGRQPSSTRDARNSSPSRS